MIIFKVLKLEHFTSAVIRFTQTEIDELSKVNDERIAEDNLKNYYKMQAKKAALFDELLSRLK